MRLQHSDRSLGGDGRQDARRVVVDTRGRSRLEVPLLPDLPDREPLPGVLADFPATALPPQARPSVRSLRHLPVAAMPRVVPGSRTEQRQVDVYIVIDMSPSNQWTDPQGARHHDLAYLAREWARQVIPDDLITPVLFDRTADMYPACRPADVPRDGWGALPAPNPLLGGTCFLPPAQAVTRDARMHPRRAAVAIYCTDGIPSDVNDIAQASAVLTAAGITAVLIPYGPDFPWISAHWEHSAFRIAAHVGDRRRAIAQTVALAILSITGHRRGR